MLNLDREIQHHRSDSEQSESRYTNISRAVVHEYQAKQSGYASLDISLHDAKLETLKTSTRTLRFESGEKVKVKIISFERSDGVLHEIKLFGERY